MKRGLSLVAVLAALVVAGPSAARAGDEKALGETLRKESSLDRKKEAARELAAKKSAAAREQLLAALEDDTEGWTQEAGVYGLVLLGDAKLDEKVVEFVEEHFMTADGVAAAVKERKSFSFDVLSRRYAKTTGFQARSSFVKIASAIRTKESEAFLREAIAAKGEARESEARGLAFAALAEGPPAALHPLAVELARTDDELGPTALAFLVEKGTAADLAVALHVIDEKKDASEALLVAAYRGVVKWCDAKTQRERYLAALRSKSEDRVRAAVASFELAPDAETAPLLARVVRHGVEQRTRLLAALRLAHAPAPAAGARDVAVPALVGALRETFQPKEETPVLANLLTLGIAGVFDYLGRAWDRKAFDHTMGEIAAALAKRTGEKHGTSHEKWAEWAILRGHTVDGHNVIQLLFAPDKAARRRAHDGAARLAGFKDRGDFAAKSALGDDDGAIALALAKKLVEKGFLVDEE